MDGLDNRLDGWMILIQRLVYEEEWVVRWLMVEWIE